MRYFTTTAELSVCPMPEPKQRMEAQCELKVGRIEAHGMGDP